MKRQAVVLALVLLVAMPAMGATFAAMDQDKLVMNSQSVVVGRIVDQTSAWTESGRLIYTDNTLEIDEIVIGKAPRVVTVRTYGGQVGDIIIEAPGFPKFEMNEHVLLFLRRDTDTNSIRVTGYQQGHFRFVERLDGVKLAVPQLDESANLLDAAGRPVGLTESVGFEAFKANIREKAHLLGRAQK